MYHVQNDNTNALHGYVKGYWSSVILLDIYWTADKGILHDILQVSGKYLLVPTLNKGGPGVGEAYWSNKGTVILDLIKS